ncbi:hypothetical protein GRAN_2255 [Granulicella sibirica]|uniref:Uncharacterized protein n=1 Tax=Granulicella sibirica TaxID=2479048 RepID=A0A4Q0T5C1_9BACT|nr:hypothetical protein GRAN_2255 [Granulicella sibirica]
MKDPLHRRWQDSLGSVSIPIVEPRANQRELGLVLGEENRISACLEP